MAIPKKLRLFTLYVDGTNHIGKIPSVTLPKVTRKTEDYQGGGMQGAVAVDLGLDGGALDASMVVGGVVEELILKYGGDIDEMRLRFVGEIYSGGTSSLMEVEMRGRITEIDPGEAKQGDDTNHTYAIKNTYYKLSVDDKALLEIDLLNFIYKRDGKNLYPDRIVSALGLGG
ncbi:phage major tail tube protein [Serratia marcescens]|uniref:Major tail tube protein n=3 Tax=root TaxID=1 RepID=TAILC_BPSK2|nr:MULTISPECIES: phage major tail tube protein [Serratia]P85988.2 RecName: Full=Major tail tube protein; AltName: Full=GpFII-like protein; AltName: Full=Virion protein C [Serratia phage KSP20]MBJ7892354.1 phage major tail tube protein [Serratia sp. PAMC26656]APS34608.1 tail protein [Serratia marcescens]AVU34926.1 phage major tail tube protein [Serratia marcescens]AVU40029.1 phage major tail tube protein [Serratia marcescens]EIG9086405.1 phage major tail tube protein [Serratia marcescens]